MPGIASPARLEMKHHHRGEKHIGSGRKDISLNWSSGQAGRDDGGPRQIAQKLCGTSHGI